MISRTHTPPPKTSTNRKDGRRLVSIWKAAGSTMIVDAEHRVGVHFLAVCVRRLIYVNVVADVLSKNIDSAENKGIGGGKSGNTIVMQESP